jgi:hypothetical protein
MWLMLAQGYKLMALVSLHLVNLILVLTWLLWHYSGLFCDLFAQRAKSGAINWREEIWPFQWRIAGSWMAGYFGTQAITLILFACVGPVEAGKFGFTLMAISAIASASTSWVTTKSPRFGRLVAQFRYNELNILFGHARKGALFVGFLGGASLVVSVAVLASFQVEIVDRFVPILGVVFMVAAMLANVSITADATYLRAFRREPYLVLSMVIGALQALAAFLLSEPGDVLRVVYSYALINIGIGFFWARMLFRRLSQDYVTP